MPITVLGAVLVSAAIDLIDVSELRTLHRISRPEFAFAIGTMLGVVIIGVLQGVVIAIAATLAHLLWLASRPRIASLGQIDGKPGLHKLHRHPEARAIPGLTIVVLQAALIFFNADYVKRQVLEIVDTLGDGSRWFVLDAEAINLLDTTGVARLEEWEILLRERGITFLVLKSIPHVGRFALQVQLTHSDTTKGHRFGQPSDPDLSAHCNLRAEQLLLGHTQSESRCATWGSRSIMLLQ